MALSSFKPHLLGCPLCARSGKDLPRKRTEDPAEPRSQSRIWMRLQLQTDSQIDEDLLPRDFPWIDSTYLGERSVRNPYLQSLRTVRSDRRKFSAAPAQAALSV